MKKLAHAVTTILFFVLLMLFMIRFDAHAQKGPVEIRWAASATGAALYPLSTAMVEDLKKNIPEVARTSSAVPTSGPVGNVILVAEGKRANIGISFSDMAGRAWVGEEPYKGQIRNFRNVATFYRQVFQWVVWAESGINKVQDLKGKRVCPFNKGLSAEFMASKVLAAYGMSYDDMKPTFLGFADGAENMKDGHLDALLGTTFFYPFPSFVEMASIKPIKLLSLDKDKIEKLVKENIGIEPFTLPPNTYKGVSYPVPGIATRNHIIVREDMPEDLVYKITKVLAENYDRYGDIIQAMKQIKKEEIAADVGIPFHPGSVKYYTEKGWLKVKK
jgi:TRAP transporter TAXI family solute receptor